MNLHNAIMNIQERVGMYRDPDCYKLGHRDARHAAAELANKYDLMIEELLDALEARNADDYVDAFKVRNNLD